MGLLERLGFGAESDLRKHAARVANRRAQPQQRWESIEALHEMQTAEAVDALLVRFTFTTDPTISDQEEKDAVFEAVIEAGERAVDPLRKFLRRYESISWGLKCLENILSVEEVTTELLGLLERMDVEYERDPEKKVQALAALEERKDARIGPAIGRFLSDASESVRFRAVGALLAQEVTPEIRSSLIDLLLREESLRVRARILDGFAEQEWDLSSVRDAARSVLPQGYAIDAGGRVRRSASG